MNDEQNVAAVDHALAVTTAEEAVNTATTAHKEAVKNVKLAKDYLKAMTAAVPAVGAEGYEVAKAAADTANETYNAWVVSEGQHKAAVAAAKTLLKDAKTAMKAANKPVKAAKVAVERVEQNGQRKPSAGTSSDTLWGVYDAVAVKLGRSPALEDVLVDARATGIVDGTIKAAYAHWRKFHGVTGRVVSETKLAAANAAKAEKEAKDLAKAQAKLAAAVPPVTEASAA